MYIIKLGTAIKSGATFEKWAPIDGKRAARSFDRDTVRRDGPLPTRTGGARREKGRRQLPNAKAA
jgi:hypothetical protein